MIKTAQIVEDESGEDEVGLNDLVTVHFEDDGMEEEYKIVTTVRSDALNQMISIDSPMGKALLKHRVGERVLVKVNDKVSYYVTIRGIRKTMMNRKKLINSRFCNESDGKEMRNMWYTCVQCGKNLNYLRRRKIL